MGCRVTEIRLVVPDEPTVTDRADIFVGLAAFNRGHAEPGWTGPLAVLLKDENDDTVGGLWGSTVFNWLQVELVFVPENQRGASLGLAIMQRAETLAIARGCIGVSLDTYSFQARGFYEKLGYSLVGAIADCPPGNARYFLQKRLDLAA
jgi:GNAT superfamily N-acetyltransferase